MSNASPSIARIVFALAALTAPLSIQKAEAAAKKPAPAAEAATLDQAGIAAIAPWSGTSDQSSAVTGLRIQQFKTVWTKNGDAVKPGLKPADVAAVKAPAAKDDDDDDKKDDDDKEEPKPATHVAIDISTSMSTNRTMSTGVAVTASMSGKLEESGARFHIESSMDADCCIGRPSPDGIAPPQFSGNVMVGYELVGEHYSISAFVGVNSQSAAATAGAPAGSGQGLQVAAEANFNPDDHLMASVSGSYSTLNSALSTRAKLGIAVVEDVYVGPDISYMANATSHQMRYGVFISGLKFHNMTFGVSGGYAVDRARGPSVYAGIDMRVAF